MLFEKNRNEVILTSDRSSRNSTGTREGWNSMFSNSSGSFLGANDSYLESRKVLVSTL